MQKGITKFLILTIILTAALSVNYLFAAWVGPTQAPPGGNTSTPVHVGSTDQVKEGGLSLDALSVFGGGYFQGNVGVGVVTPTAALDVTGNIKASGTVCDNNGCIGSGSGGKVVQVVHSSEGARHYLGNKSIPWDSSPPLSSEGNLVPWLNTTITPQDANNKLLIEVKVHVSFISSSPKAIVALFQDSGGQAVAVTFSRVADSSTTPLTLRHFMDAGTTNPTTFKIRIGGNSAGQININDRGSNYGYGKTLGNLLDTSMTITEFLP